MNLTTSLLRVSLVTGVLLLIPVLGMQFSTDVNWTAADFVAAGALLLVTGFALELIASKRGSVAYRLAAAGAVLAALLQIWANLAVGFIGSGPNAANLLCGVVPVVGLAGAVMAGFRPRGMAYAMLAMALVQLLVPVLAVLVWNMQLTTLEWAASGVFAAAWLAAAWLFQRSDSFPAQRPQQFA